MLRVPQGAAGKGFPGEGGGPRGHGHWKKDWSLTQWPLNTPGLGALGHAVEWEPHAEHRLPWCGLRMTQDPWATRLVSEGLLGSAPWSFGISGQHRLSEPWGPLGGVL